MAIAKTADKADDFCMKTQKLSAFLRGISKAQIATIDGHAAHGNIEENAEKTL